MKTEFLRLETQIFLSALFGSILKLFLGAKVDFQRKRRARGQHRVSGKLTIDHNFGATLKSTSLILKHCCPGRLFSCGEEDVDCGEMELGLLEGND